MTATPLPDRTAFLLGVAMSLVPAVGPFAAALLLISRRWRFKRRDALWGSAAAATALAAAVTGGALEALLAVATVAGPWIVFRTFEELKYLGLVTERIRPLGTGLLTGFAAVIALRLAMSLQGFAFDASRTIAQAIVWQGSPALFGHSVLVMGGLIALLTRNDRRVSMTAMALAAFGILLSGSIEAALAWLVLAVLQIVTRDADARRPRAAEIVMLLVMLAVATGLAPLLGWGRVGFLLTPERDAGVGRNLLAGTEVPQGDWWDDRWVRVDAGTATLDGRTLTTYEVTKLGPEPWLRLQQLVRLQPGGTYTLSAWILPGENALPALQGRGHAPGDGRSFEVLARLIDGDVRSFVSGPGRLLNAGVVAEQGAWRRVAVTFAYAADAPALTWFAGVAPDGRTLPGAASTFAGLQLEAAPAAGPYQAAPAVQGLSFGYARAPLWRTAWDAIRERPLFGWGSGRFADVYVDDRPGVDRQEVVPRHPHNQLLTTAFERGALGVVGLGLLLVALFGLGVRYRDLGLLALGLAVLIANTFDATLLSGSVLYPLAAVAGWRSSRRGARRADGAEGVRQGTVRVSLAAIDALAVLLSLLVAARLSEAAGQPVAVGAGHLLVLALWPAMSWREGLYPGYGLTPAQELKKQMVASAYAVALLATAAFLFPETIPLPVPALAAFAALAAVSVPVARAGAKRMLHAMRLWGRPVVVLGAGETGRRVARALGLTPLDGLHPVAFFDDDASLRTTMIEGIRVRGTLDEANAFAARHHVRHAIVAIPQLRAERLDRLVTGSGRVFRRVQFVPKLAGLPSTGVLATDLDGMLALEVRNGLFAPANRAAKRLTDLASAGLATVLAAPLLLAIWIWVRVDSPGGAFHRSERIGQDGRPFRCLKFRTMHADAEQRLEELLAADPALRAEYETWHKLEDDPRITRAGAFLRRTSLDELPQLWNVLKGEMSLVGPRPYLAREVRDMGGYAPIIFQAKPGITGYWQVSARNTVSFAERLEMEAHYVRNWSVWWDVILTVQTPLVVLRNEGEAK